MHWNLVDSKHIRSFAVQTKRNVFTILESTTREAPSNLLGLNRSKGG